MCEGRLLQDINNCVIDFGKKVLITNLLDEYGGQLDSISKVVQETIESEEQKGKKFKKEFLVRGLEDDFGNQIITIVPEGKLEDVLAKLKDSYCILYSVEPPGSSKSLPTPLTPVKHKRLVLPSNIREEIHENLPSSSIASDNAKSENVDIAKPKHENVLKKESTKDFFKTQKKDEHLVEEKESKSPEQVKNNFFSKMNEKNPKSKNNQKEERKIPETSKKVDFFKKRESPSIKEEKKVSETPKKADFFKKRETTATKAGNQCEGKAAEEEKKSLELNSNLKDTIVIPTEEESSSDEEEALAALKKECLSDEDQPQIAKKRRIDDTDDEESPEQIKIEDDKDEVKTFQDDDGFMITVKEKIKKSESKPAPQKSSPVKKTKRKLEETPKKSSVKVKQGSITNFFSKK